MVGGVTEFTKLYWLCFFIIKGFWTIVFIFIVISTTFRLKCTLAFFRCLSKPESYTELRTMSFIEFAGLACSDSVNHNRVQALRIPLLLLACSQNWTSSVGCRKGCSSKFRVGSRVWQTPEEGRRTFQLKHCGNNNKNEDNNPKTLNDKNHQASSQNFRQLILTLLSLCLRFL